VRIRKELWFGLILMAVLILATLAIMPTPAQMTNGHLGLLMLCLVVVAIMLGFPTAFTLMGMGVLFAYLAYRSQSPEIAVRQTLDLMVQRTYAVMTNDVLISIPLFVFMGYLVERSALIEKLFRSLHLAIGRLPGSLAVATLVTCAVFATATGIVGAVVTLMGLLALPAMLRSGYDVKLSAGVITAGGCLGILIPPSVLLILYGATASVSVVQLYAGAFFPGIMLAGLYIGYVIIRAWLNPKLAPPPLASESHVDLPPWVERLGAGPGRKAVPALVRGLGAPRERAVSKRLLGREIVIALMPAITLFAILAVIQRTATQPAEVDRSGLVEIGGASDEVASREGALAEPPGDGVQEPPGDGVRELSAVPPATDARPPSAIPTATDATPAPASTTGLADPERLPTPRWFWLLFGLGLAALAVHYAIFTLERLEILKMLLASFFPLATLILAVLGSIIFGWATPTEAAAMGATGGLLLAAAYRRLTLGVVRESAYLTAKTTAMVCWLFVGSSIFSAAFALLGGQQIIERWVLSLDMSPVQFMLLAQFIIFVLGWPLEWTEIIVIFMPIFLPLLAHFQIDPLFFGLLVALNLQTAFLSPPVAMAAFYLKGVAPRHVTLNQIFGGMMPFMGIQLLALALLYIFPGIGLWLPRVLYR
jgi:TRAP-type mannitol/chloroaromatic compound transport system permease large subunit